jgi:pimeloyl-ACP methyl ester carboxylesterase
LLVHGMRDLAWSLDPIARAFRDRFHVVSLDLRGHGDSDHVGYYALPHFILDVRAAVHGLGLERPVLVGHSFGGEVVAQYAGLFPEVPRAVVLIEGLGPPPWEGEGSREAGVFWARSMVERLDAIDPEGRAMASLDEATERIRASHPRLDPVRARFLAEQGTRPHASGGWRWKWDPYLVTTWGSFNFGQMEQMWSRIAAPTLATNGARSGEFWRRDALMARRGADSDAYLAADELQRRLDCFRDVECVEIPGAGHMVHFDEPDALNAAIDDFLRRRVGS